MSWSNITHYDVHFYVPVSLENRTHKLCRLPNGLLTLLISDPTENSSGCSLTVAAGSHNDLNELPGLAHLCEHMILASGSKKHPKTGVYHEMIAKNGGSQNAFTTGELTSFYFELPSFHSSTEINFAQTLEVFSSLFIDPIFNSNGINKEIYAIESEHNANVSSTNKIFYHATRLLANEKHPFHRFGTGNMTTLNTLALVQSFNLKEELQRYFDENYVSSRMTLCIRSPQSVNTLIKMAVKNFGEIPHYRPATHRLLNTVRSPATLQRIVSWKSPTLKQINKKCDSIHESRILDEYWSKKYADSCCFSTDINRNTLYIESEKQTVVKILFPVQNKFTRFTAKDVKVFSHFWSEIFGDESEGSLCHFFMSKGWITSCFAYVSEFAIDNVGLALEMTLTDTGWNSLVKMLETIISIIMPLFSEKQTVELAKFLSDQYCIDILRLIFQTKEQSPMKECFNLSESLQGDLGSINPSLIFSKLPMISSEMSDETVFFHEHPANEKWWIGQAIKFQSFLREFMIPENMRLIILGAIKSCPMPRKFNLSANVTPPNKDPIYGFEYYEEMYDWSEFKTKDKWGNNFHFPRNNQFKPKWADSFANLRDILVRSSNKSRSAALSFSINNDLFESVPSLVSKNNLHEMWILTDDVPSSLKSKSIVSLDLTSTEINPSPENTMNLEILLQVIYIFLSANLYPSTKLGYSYELSCPKDNSTGISVTISGFSDRLKTLLDTIISAIKRIVTDQAYPSPGHLKKASTLVKATYQEAAEQNCVKLGTAGLLVALETTMWTFEERMKALDMTNMEKFKNFCRLFVKGPKYVRLFIQGATSCADQLNKYLNDSFTYHLRREYMVKAPTKSSNRTKILEPGINVFIEHKGKSNDPNNSITYFIQTGKRTEHQNITLSALVEFIFSFSLVSELRTKRQVGYFVMGGLRLLTDSIGVHITIMSNEPCMNLEYYINEYLTLVEKEVDELNDGEFLDKYLNPFINMYKNGNNRKLRQLSGPVDILNEVVSNVQDGDTHVFNSSTMCIHKKFKKQITNEEHSFVTNGFSIDLEFVNGLTRKQFRRFYKEKISIFSECRSKISVMIMSSMNGNEIAACRLTTQLQMFLKMNGLVIGSEELQNIVKNAEGKPILIARQLYQSFRGRNESWRLCSTVLREIFKLIWCNLKPTVKNPLKKSINTWDIKVQPTIDLIPVLNLNDFKTN